MFRCLLQSTIDQNTKVKFVHNNRSQHSEYHCTQVGGQLGDNQLGDKFRTTSFDQLGGKTIRRRGEVNADASVTYQMNCTAKKHSRLRRSADSALCLHAMCCSHYRRRGLGFLQVRLFDKSSSYHHTALFSACTPLRCCRFTIKIGGSLKAAIN